MPSEEDEELTSQPDGHRDGGGDGMLSSIPPDDAGSYQQVGALADDQDIVSAGAEGKPNEHPTVEAADQTQ
jgi:hypothetical protein